MEYVMFGKLSFSLIEAFDLELLNKWVKDSY